MELGEPDASGRRRPVPIPGSEFVVEVDTIIAAIGQNVESDGLGVESNRGRLVVDKLTLETPLPAYSLAATLSSDLPQSLKAVGQGIEAAESIHRYLRHSDLREGRQLMSWPKPEDIEIETSLPVRWGKRAVMAELPIAQRVSGFEEVELGFSAEEAMAEAKRCLSCGVCSECMQCVTACHARSYPPR